MISYSRELFVLLREVSGLEWIEQMSCLLTESRMSKEQYLRIFVAHYSF
jgi:hypothetical protein